MKKTLLVLVIAAVVIGAAYYLYPRSGPASQTPSDQSSTTVAANIPGWQSCNYPAFGFSMFYPPDWEITARGNAQGAGGNISTVTCGVTQPLDIVPDLTFVHAKQATETTPGSMDLSINNGTNAGSIEGYLEQNSYYAHKYPLISTTTINGYPVGMFQGNRAVILAPGGTYTMTFGTSTATSTQENIIQTFRFVSGPTQ